MGLGLYLFGQLPPSAFESFRESPLRRVEAEARDFSREAPAPLGDWYRGSVSEDVASIVLFPCEEPVEFTLSGTCITCSAKTSTAGPGYHAHLVRLLDRLSAVLGVQWASVDPSSDDEGGDETGYFEARDFDALQAAMVGWLRGLAETLMEDRFAQASCVLLGLPLDGPRPVSAAFALSPMGEWSRAFFGQLTEADDEVSRRLSATFFPWWDEGVTAENLHSFALTRAWMDLRWAVGTKDEDSDEWELARSVLQAYERGAPRPGTIVPAREFEELARSLREAGPLRAPASAGIGFRRRVMTHTLPGSFSVDVPGYFFFDCEDDGSTAVYYFLGRTVRATTLRFESDPVRSSDSILASISALDGASPLELDAPHLRGQAAERFDDDERCHVLEARIASPGGLCIVSIYYEDSADAEWARNTAASIHCPPPEAE